MWTTVDLLHSLRGKDGFSIHFLSGVQDLEPVADNTLVTAIVVRAHAGEPSLVFKYLEISIISLVCAEL
jgi:hypothetical protein